MDTCVLGEFGLGFGEHWYSCFCHENDVLGFGALLTYRIRYELAKVFFPWRRNQPSLRITTCTYVYLHFPANEAVTGVYSATNIAKTGEKEGLQPIVAHGFQVFSRSWIGKN